MFGLFGKKKEPFFSEDILDKFKMIMNSKEGKEILNHFRSGDSRIPLLLSVKVNELNALLYSLSFRSDINAENLLNLAISGNWGVVEDRLKKMGDLLKNHREKNSPKFKQLALWADKNKIPELSDLNAMTYKQSGISRDPEKIQEMQFLYIPNNNLKEIPDAIDAMFFLKAMCLNDNEISEIPDSIGNLIGLQRIDVFNNKLTTLPISIGKLKHLFALDLDGNNISFLPRELLECNNLSDVRLKKQKHGIELDFHPEYIEKSRNVLGRLEDRGCRVRI